MMEQASCDYVLIRRQRFLMGAAGMLLWVLNHAVERNRFSAALRLYYKANEYPKEGNSKDAEERPGKRRAIYLA